MFADNPENYVCMTTPLHNEMITNFTRRMHNTVGCASRCKAWGSCTYMTVIRMWLCLQWRENCHAPC